MIKKKKIELEEMLIDRLRDRMTLMQQPQERHELVMESLQSAIEQDKSRFYATELNSDEEKNQFVRDFLSYGPVESLLCNSDVEDIIVNGINKIHIHHAQKGFIETEQYFESYKELEVFIRKILMYSGLQDYNKIANFSLPNLTGRVNIVDSPFGPQLTITKAKVDPVSIIDLINFGSMNYEVAAQLWVYIDGMAVRPANMIIAGGPGTGKTTLLNALMSFIPETDRTVVIEDTLELNTLLSDSCSRLESDDEVTLADLVKNTLRMRPERIVVGEVRGEEARDMVTAINVGKYCMGTIHSLTAREAIIRLQNQPMNIPQMLINLIDVFVVLKRYHVDGKVYRVVDEIAETGAMDTGKVLLAPVCKYDYEQHQIVPMSPSTVYRDRLSREAGVPPRVVINETIARAYVLKTLNERGIKTNAEITAFARMYRADPKKAMEKIGINRQKLLKEIDQEYN